MSLSFYKVNTAYCDFLREKDPCVPFTMEDKKNRPFVGIVVRINEMNYYAPLTSPKPKHLHMNENVDFIKIDEGRLGAINLNNMIPVPQEYLTKVNTLILPTDTKEESDYKNLLMDQLSWCNSNKDKIKKRANNLYDIIIHNKATQKLADRCCDFKTDEEQLKEYKKLYLTNNSKQTEEEYVDKLKKELSVGVNSEYKTFCETLSKDPRLNDETISIDKRNEIRQSLNETMAKKKEELKEVYLNAISMELSLYQGVTHDNVIYFDQRDEAIFEQVKAFYDSQPQSKIDKILENINSLPKGLNPEGKLDILRNNGIKHSNEMEPEERKAAFEKEEIITPKFGGKDI